jgi:uncharacterized membrane protein YoaK (UPF0700 family)
VKAVVACVLSWAAGFIDVAGALSFFHVYVSHMSGNTAAMGTNLAGRNWTDLARYTWPLIWFVAGLLFSAFTTVEARRHRVNPSFSFALVAELIVILAVTWRHDADWISNSMLAAAMGIQTVTVTRVAGLRVYTTYLTGSLSKFSEALIEFGFWFRDRNRGRWRQRIARVLRITPRIKYFRHALLTAALWATFFAGAICGAWLMEQYQLRSLWAPACGIGFAIVVDLVEPVAAADAPRKWDDL